MSEDAPFSNDSPSIDFAAMLATLSSPSLANLAQSCEGFIEALKPIHPIKAAASFGALLTQKLLQYHCLRLESLVHLCLVFGRGSRAPTAQLLAKGYAIAGQACGTLEDPPEDIFVGNIYSKRGNYSVLEGLWESGTFFLQRFINLVDELPPTDDFSSVVNSIYALLAVSDYVCGRAGLKRNDLGNTQRVSSLPQKLVNNSNNLLKLVQIEFSELQRANINIEDLLPFVFDPNHRNQLLAQNISNSSLETQPIAIDDGKLYLLLPTSVSVAIRRFFLRALGTGDNRQVFLGRLGLEYVRTFEKNLALGTYKQQVRFSHHSWGSTCCMSSAIDQGRFLNLIFFMDTLEDFESRGFSGTYQGNEEFFAKLTQAIIYLQDRAQNTVGFREGITLFISCGIGRSTTFQYPAPHRDHWVNEFLSASDYCTLSRLNGIQPLDLWRILQMKSRLKQMNVKLHNLNGFLNLYAWADSQEGHLIPHASIPDEAIGKPFYFAITQNSLLNLRRSIEGACVAISA